MTVRELASLISGGTWTGNGDVSVAGVCIDSRKVASGDLFFALKGSNADGVRFIQDAVSRGAAAVASDSVVSANSVPVIRLPDARKALGKISANVYGQPTSKMGLVGITGTNGKTTTCFLLEEILRSASREPAYVGTVSYRWKGTEHPSSMTTPEACDLQRMFKRMLDESVTDVVMECSSHGIELGRLNGIEFNVAVFTNLTQDHLDFHGTMDAYRAAKRKLFFELLPAGHKQNQRVVLNFDDSVGREWGRSLSDRLLSYSIDDPSTSVHPTKVQLTPQGISASLSVEGRAVQIASKLTGRHNLSNILAAVGAGHALGIPLDAIARGIASVEGVPGRLERIPNSKGFHVFVDYAHSEDALVNVLQALTPFKSKRLIVVFGCGGDRDRAKRPRMGAAVVSRSDITIVTSDNPRSEDPETIISEIVRGIPSSVPGKSYSAITDRRTAIETALRTAEEGDLVLIAGKGHETYQEIQGVKHPFDDREICRRFLGGAS